MFRKIKIWFLKKKLKNAYIFYVVYRDQYSCGLALASHILGDLYMLKQNCKDIHKKLKEIDPECPDMKL